MNAAWAGFTSAAKDAANFNPMSPGVMAYAVDPERAKALWATSEELVGERF